TKLDEFLYRHQPCCAMIRLGGLPKQTINNCFTSVALDVDAVEHLALAKGRRAEIICYRLGQHYLTGAGNMRDAGSIIDSIAEYIVAMQQGGAEGNADAN